MRGGSCKRSRSGRGPAFKGARVEPLAGLVTLGRTANKPRPLVLCASGTGVRRPTPEVRWAQRVKKGRSQILRDTRGRLCCGPRLPHECGAQRPRRQGDSTARPLRTMPGEYPGGGPSATTVHT